MTGGQGPQHPQRLQHPLEEIDESEQLVLSDLINRVLDKGVMIKSHITISVADIDLIELDLNLLISSVSAMRTKKI